MILPGLDNGAIASWASGWYKDRKSELQTKHLIWNECVLAVASQFGESWAEVDAYRSHRYLALPWQAIETVSSSYVNGVMPSDDWFEVLGRTPDDDSKAKLNESLLKWQHFKTGFRQDVKQIVKLACEVGNAPYCVDWLEEIIAIPDQEAYTAQLAHMNVMKEAGLAIPENANPNVLPQKMMRSYDGPKLKVGNIFDYVMDLRPNTSKFAMRGMRTRQTKAYLEDLSQADSEGYALYENLDQVQDLDTETEPTDSTQKATEMGKGYNRMPKGMVELVQIEGDIEIPNGIGGTGLYKNHILVVANKTTLIRFEPSPFYYGRPSWNHFTLYTDPMSPFGYGLIEPVLGINDGIQCRYNQVIDANTLAVNPGWKYKEDGIFDPDEFTSVPGGLTKMADTNNLAPLIVPTNSALGMNEVNFAISQFNLITGASENFGGGAEGGPVSATQSSIQAQMSAERRKETLNHINAWLMDVLDRQMSLNMQLMDEPTWIRVVSDGQGGAVDPNTGLSYPPGPRQMRLSPEEIVGQFDVIAVGANKIAQDRQKAQDLFQLTTALLQSPMAKYIKGGEAVQEFYKMGGFSDAYKFVKSEQEVIADEQRELDNQLTLKPPIVGGPNARAEGGGSRGVGSPGPEPGPSGAASISGVPEGPGAIPSGPNQAQLAGNRLA